MLLVDVAHDCIRIGLASICVGAHDGGLKCPLDFSLCRMTAIVRTVKRPTLRALTAMPNAMTCSTDSTTAIDDHPSGRHLHTAIHIRLATAQQRDHSQHGQWAPLHTATEPSATVPRLSDRVNKQHTPPIGRLSGEFHPQPACTASSSPHHSTPLLCTLCRTPSPCSVQAGTVPLTVSHRAPSPGHRSKKPHCSESNGKSSDPPSQPFHWSTP